MMRFVLKLAGACLSMHCLCLPVYGQTSSQFSTTHVQSQVQDQESTVVFELGTAASWNFSGGAATFAPNFAAESTLKKSWLEIEAGVSPFYTHAAQEWDSDLLFKKPWTLSPKLEFMLGVGPAWVHVKQNGKWSNSLTGEMAGDFMFWPTGRHRFGWYLEPAYGYSFAGRHLKSIGMSGGLLIGFR